MTLISRILKGLNLKAFLYQRDKATEKCTFSVFSIQRLRSKFALAIKQVKVNPGSSFI